MDKRTKMEVISIVSTAIEDTITRVMEGYNEQYVTAPVLMEQYQMITPDWLKKYGKLLPQTRITVTEADGSERHSRTAYARNKIAKMIADGSIERLRVSGQ